MVVTSMSLGAAVARKCPCFYGWVVVAACSFVSAFVAHIGAMHINVLTMPLIYAEFFERGVARSTISMC